MKPYWLLFKPAPASIINLSSTLPATLSKLMARYFEASQLSSFPGFTIALILVFSNVLEGCPLSGLNWTVSIPLCIYENFYWIKLYLYNTIDSSYSKIAYISNMYRLSAFCVLYLMMLPACIIHLGIHCTTQLGRMVSFRKPAAVSHLSVHQKGWEVSENT